MDNEIIGAICKKIDETFKNVNIYLDYIGQGFLTPSFSIRLVEKSEKILLSGRYKIFNKMEIIYFPEDEEDKRKKCNEISNILMDKLEKIEYDDGLIRAENIEMKFEKNKILIMLEYNFYIFKKEKHNKMERIFV